MPYVDPVENELRPLLSAWVMDTQIFQNTACTTAADEDNDDVRCINSIVGDDVNSSIEGDAPGASPFFLLEDATNGRAVTVMEEGTDDVLQGTAGDGISSQAAVTIGIVFQIPSAGNATNRNIYAQSGSTGNGFLRFFYNDTAGTFQVDNQINGQPTISVTLSSLGLSTGDWCMAVLDHSATTDETSLRINGVAIGKPVCMLQINTAAGVFLGDAIEDGTTASNIRYAAIARYDGVLNGSDQLLLETYLNREYVSNAPLPAPPPITFIDILGSTDTTHSYAGLALLDSPSVGTSSTRDINDSDSDEQQFRIFLNGIELNRPGTVDSAGVDIADYTVNETAKTITLNQALRTFDRMIIMRQTRRDRPYVTFTNSALLKQSPDINLFIDQVLFIIQESQEEALIQKIFDNITYPDVRDRSGYNFTLTGSTSSGPFDYSDIDLINDNRVAHDAQLAVLKNDVVLQITTDYTIDATNEELTLVDALIVADALEIRRQTSRDRYVPNLPNASSFSSDMVELQFIQLRHLIHELPTFLGLDVTAIRNYRRPRRKTFVKYSGPGDRFYYGNLPWYEDGSTYVWRDDSLLTEIEDYHNSDWSWLIDLIDSLLATEQLTISVQPGCQFSELFCNGPYHFGATDPDDPLGANDPADQDDPPPGPTTSIPQILVPVTADSDTDGGVGGSELHINGDTTSLSSVFLHWDLTFFQGRTATAVTFGLYERGSMGATDTVILYEATAAGARVVPNVIIDTWAVNDTLPNDNWHVTNSLLSFVNTRLADDGNVYIRMEAETTLDKFEAWSIDGQMTASVFGPHMSLEGAPYPAPGIPGVPVGDNQILNEADAVSVGTLSSGYSYDVSVDTVFAFPSHLIGGTTDGTGDGTVDPRWHDYSLPFGLTILQNSIIHSAILTTVTTRVDAGAGSLSQSSGSNDWTSHVDFLSRNFGPTISGPGGVGVNVIDVTAILQDLIDTTNATGISIWHFTSAVPDATSAIVFGTGGNPLPTLYVDFSLPP